MLGHQRLGFPLVWTVAEADSLPVAGSWVVLSTTAVLTTVVPPPAVTRAVIVTVAVASAASVPSEQRTGGPATHVPALVEAEMNDKPGGS